MGGGGGGEAGVVVVTLVVEEVVVVVAMLGFLEGGCEREGAREPDEVIRAPRASRAKMASGEAMMAVGSARASCGWSWSIWKRRQRGERIGGVKDRRI